MELILWRHAEAEDTDPDLARALTPKGRHQAQKMAHWLKSQFTGPVRILSSPAVRTRQTADALGLPYDLSEQIAPDRSADDLLAASGWPDGHGLVILVGHNPAISVLASRLASTSGPPVAMRRAQACWVVFDGDSRQPGVKAMMTPSLLEAG